MANKPRILAKLDRQDALDKFCENMDRIATALELIDIDAALATHSTVDRYLNTLWAASAFRSAMRAARGEVGIKETAH